MNIIKIAEKYNIKHLDTSDGRIFMIHENVLQDLVKEQNEAITFTPCCTELKAVDIIEVEDIPDPYWEEYIEGKQ